MGWWITLGILVLLAILPLGVSVRYDAGGAVVKVMAGPVRFTLFPRPNKEKKPKKEKKSGISKAEPNPVQPAEPKPAAQPEQQKPDKPKEKPKKEGGSLSDFLPLVKIALDFLGDFRRKLRVNVLEMKLILAADDPCDLAVNYGRAWAALGNLLPRLERFLVIKKRNLEVECDFTAIETLVTARIDLSITLGRLLGITAVFAFRAIRDFLKITNKRKGGAVNESKSS